MANDLATLNGKLATALRDTTHATWATGEKDDLIKYAVADLYPLLSRPILPASASVTLVSGTYYYNLPAGVYAVSSVDLLDSGGNDLSAIAGSAWEIVGDVWGGTAQIHIAPAIASIGGSLRLHGYGVYDTTTNLIPDAWVPLVIAIARAEAYRRIGSDREQFKVWLARNQSQNVTVNELIELVGEANREVERLRHRVPVQMQKPVPGRQG